MTIRGLAIRIDKSEVACVPLKNEASFLSDVASVFIGNFV